MKHPTKTRTTTTMAATAHMGTAKKKKVNLFISNDCMHNASIVIIVETMCPLHSQ